MTLDRSTPTEAQALLALSKAQWNQLGKIPAARRTPHQVRLLVALEDEIDHLKCVVHAERAERIAR